MCLVDEMNSYTVSNVDNADPFTTTGCQARDSSWGIARYITTMLLSLRVPPASALAGTVRFAFPFTRPRA